MEYNNSKIYKLWVNETDDIYIGSTCSTLTKRLCGHKSCYKRWKDGKKEKYKTSFKLFEIGNVMIELVEAYPCKCKDELRAREGFYIRQEECVNKVVAGRDHKEYLKKYREDNKEKLKAHHIEYMKKKLAQKKIGTM